MIDRDTIINMAREAGFKIKRFAGPDGQFPVAQRSDGRWVDVGSELAEFAELVAAAERERCIEACEASYHWINGPEGWLQYAVDAIRARDEQ